MQFFATGSLASGLALGLTARLGAHRGRGRTTPLRLHQLAFVSSLGSLAMTTWGQSQRRERAAALNGAALVILCTLPLTSGWHRRHVEVALGTCVLHAIGLADHRRRRATGRAQAGSTQTRPARHAAHVSGMEQ